MDKELVRTFIYRRLKIYCYNGFVWCGIILNLDENSFVIRDKFQHRVILNYADVSSIEDVGAVVGA